MKHIQILVLLLITSIGFSQVEKQSFTLQEAIDYGLEHNRTAKNAALDIEAAIQQKWETTASGLPQISAEIGYQNFLKQQVSLIPAELFGGNPGEFAEAIFGSKQNMTATVTLNQKIFDGSYLVGLQSAKVFLEISKNAKEKTDLQIRNAVINAYGNVLLAEESIIILDRNIAVLEKNLNDITKIYENGLEEEESVEQLKITLSGVKSSLNNTQRLQKLAYQMLNITIGKPITSSTTLLDNLESLTTKNIVLDLLNTSDAVNNTIDYKIAENDKVAKQLLVKLEQSKALPTINAFINGGYSAFDSKFTFTNSKTKWFGSSLFGITMHIPIFSSGMRNALTQRAKINLAKAEENLTEIEQQLKLQIASAKSDYQFAIEDYTNKKENLGLAERIEQKNQTKFFEGIATSFELRQAQTQLYSTQQELLQAMLDVINKKAALETALNSIPKK